MPKPPSPASLQRAYQLFNEINIIAQLSSNEMVRVLPHGLTLSQFSVLNWFARVDDEATPGRLATAFQVTKGAMTNTLRKLEQKRFIEITADPDSGRRKLVRMTGSGRQAREAAIAATHPVLEAFVAQFGAADTAALLPKLAAIRAYLDNKRFG